MSKGRGFWDEMSRIVLIPHPWAVGPMLQGELWGEC